MILSMRRVILVFLILSSPHLHQRFSSTWENAWGPVWSGITADSTHSLPGKQGLKAKYTSQGAVDGSASSMPSAHVPQVHGQGAQWRCPKILTDMPGLRTSIPKSNGCSSSGAP